LGRVHVGECGATRRKWGRAHEASEETENH
jgi:hypothetical protein